MSDPLGEEKARLRQRLLARRRALPAAEIEAAGLAAAAVLEACEPLRGASTVALYASLPDELPTRPCFDRLRARGARVLLPRVEAGRRLAFRAVSAWEELAPGRYGVPEPPEGSEVIAPRRADAVLVPGVAFDPAGSPAGNAAS